MLGHSYLLNSHYFNVKVWICAVSLHPESTFETGSFNYQYKKFFPRVVGYNIALPCHHIMVMFNLLNHFVVTVYPAVSFKIASYI